MPETSKHITNKHLRADITLPSWRKPKRKEPAYPLSLCAEQQAMVDYRYQQARQFELKRQEERSALQTSADFTSYTQKLRRRIRKVAGLATFPKRTALNPQFGAVSTRNGYTIQKVILESRPGFFVTGTLYRPLHIQKSHTGIIQCCGHSYNGRQFSKYQILCATLAKNGAIVFSFDPVGQGERDEYIDIQTGHRTVQRACRAHGVAGTPLYLLGSSFAAIRLWDAIRAADFLSSMPEINELAACGTSGGGWESLWLSAIDPRIKKVHASCYFTSFSQRIANRKADPEPDPEQDPFGLLSTGIDACDLILACAPRKVGIGSTLNDFFPIQGAIDTYREAKTIFKRFGIEEQLDICIDDAGHALTEKMRLHLYHWLIDLNERNPESDIKPEPSFNCTTTGVVLRDLGGITVQNISAQLASELPQTANKILSKQLAKLLHIGDLPNTFSYAQNGTILGKNHTQTKYTLERNPEPSTSANLWVHKKSGQEPRAIIYIGESQHTERAFTARCRELCRPDQAVLAIKLKGCSHGKQEYLDFVPLEETMLAADSFLIGQPLIGTHVQDVIDSIAILQEHLNSAAIGIVGEGYGALVALCAAALDSRILALTEISPLVSYNDFIQHREYNWPLKFVIPNILRHFDLNDIRAQISPRALSIYNPQNYLRKSMTQIEINKSFKSLKQAYKLLGSQKDLNIKQSLPENI